MDYLKEMHELCETVSKAMVTANEKIRAAGGKLSTSDLDYVDKLTHTLKSIETTIAMKEAEMDDGYSERGSYRDGGSYRSYNRGMRGYSRDGDSYDDGSYDSRSYARGRGRYANRDSMGRYSNDGYSRDGDMMEDLHELMDKAPDDRTRQEFKNFIDKMKQMN